MPDPLYKDGQFIRFIATWGNPPTGQTVNQEFYAPFLYAFEYGEEWYYHVETDRVTGDVAESKILMQ